MSGDILTLRPRFQRFSYQSMSDLGDRMRIALDQHPDQFIGTVDHNYMTVELPHRERHFWSPQLSITLEEDKGGTIIRGLYGPRPEIWLGFMFIYGISGFMVLIILIIGLSRLNLGMSAYIIWAIPFILGGVLVLWLSSRTGQKLAHPQMVEIHRFVETQFLPGTEEYVES